MNVLTLLTFSHSHLNMHSSHEPSFVANRDKTNEYKFNFEWINDDIEFKNTIMVDDMVHEYLYCNIVISNSNFENNKAFGNSHYDSFGGALFASFSVVVMNPKIRFTKNSASNGGAFAFFETKLMQKEVTFKNNVALQNGGAVYFQGTDSKENSLTYTGNKLIFEENACNSAGGAIYISKCDSFSLTNTRFTSNKAQFNGGAIYCHNTVAAIVICRFEFNHVDQKANAVGANAKRARGGGAISFYSDNNITEGYDCMTQSCCFYRNEARGGLTFDKKSKQPADDILVDGATMYTSRGDQIDEKRIIMAKARLNIFPKGKISIYLRQESDETCNYAAPRPKEYEATYEPVLPNREVAEFNPKNPQPTTFTYQATQITRKGAIYYRPFERVSNTPNITLTSNSISVSPFRTQAIRTDVPKTLTHSLFETITITQSRITGVTITNSFNGHTWKTVNTFIDTFTFVPTIVIENTFIITYIEDIPSSIEHIQNNGNLTPIIVGTVAGIIAVIIIAIITILAVVKCKKDEEKSISSDITDESCVEMIIDEVKIQNHCECFLEQDNPLFTSQDVSADYDPFKADFEERNEFAMDDETKVFTPYGCVSIAPQELQHKIPPGIQSIFGVPAKPDSDTE